MIPLSAEEKERLREEIFSVRPDRPCQDCGGYHLRACPRVKSQEWLGEGSGAGTRIKVEYWRQGEYDDSRITYPEEAWEDEEDA